MGSRGANTAVREDEIRRAEMPPLLGSDTLREGLRILLAEGSEHLMRNAPAARRGRMEAIHQMRVALRRLRTVLRLFRGLVRAEAAAALEDELRRLGQVLGEARDWDVFCVETLPAVAAAEPGTVPPRGAMRRAAGEKRRLAHAGLRDALGEAALGALAQQLAGWHGGTGRFQVDAERALGRAAPRQVGRMEQRVRRRGRGLAEQDDEARHRLRKALKALRYGREMLRALDDAAPAGGTGAHGSGVRLQEALGGLNDAATAERLAKLLRDAARFGHRPGGRINRDAAAVQRWSARVRAEALAALPDGWERFARRGLRDER